MDTLNPAGLEPPLSETEQAAVNLASGLERISVMDARVGRELERALKTYAATRKVLARGEEA